VAAKFETAQGGFCSRPLEWKSLSIKIAAFPAFFAVATSALRALGYSSSSWHGMFRSAGRYVPWKINRVSFFCSPPTPYEVGGGGDVATFFIACPNTLYIRKTT